MVSENGIISEELTTEFIYKLKVDGLKKELEKRNLQKNSTKSELQERLVKSLSYTDDEPNETNESFIDRMYNEVKAGLNDKEVKNTEKSSANCSQVKKTLSMKDSMNKF